MIKAEFAQDLNLSVLNVVDGLRDYYIGVVNSLIRNKNMI
jgi:hypothetical protein